MSRNYRMLEKARLANALFAPGPDAEASAQEEAERQWTNEAAKQLLEPEAPVEAQPEEPVETDHQPAATPADELSTRPALPISAAPLETARATRPEPEPAAPELEDWTTLLAEALGVSAIAGQRRLLICPVSRKTRVTPLLIGLADWAVRNGAGATLMIEANFFRPRLAQALQLRSRGIDRLTASDDGSIEQAVQPTYLPGLAALAAGRPTRSDAATLKSYADWVPRLSAQFASLLVETPAADDRSLSRFPFAAHGGAVLLAVDPPLTRAVEVERAVARLRELGAPYFGAILCRHRGLDASVRIQRVAHQLAAL